MKVLRRCNDTKQSTFAEKPDLTEVSQYFSVVIVRSDFLLEDTVPSIAKLLNFQRLFQ